MDKVQKEKDHWNASLYDNNHSFVSEFGDSLLKLLAPKEGERILDLGCGTGDLAKKLFDYKVDIIGVDKSENMINHAVAKYPGIQFIVQDATNLPYNHEFDAIFSNATLHWVKSPNKALESIYKSLRKEGRFVAEFGGKGNVQLITDEMIKQIRGLGGDFRPEQFPWYFPSVGEYTSIMEEVGFRVIFAQHFDRPTRLDGEDGLVNWIEMFGSDMLHGQNNEIRDLILSNTERELKNVSYKEGFWMADYKRIRVMGVKE